MAKQHFKKKSIKIPRNALVLIVGPSSAGKSTFSTKWFPWQTVIHSDEFRMRTCDDVNNGDATWDAFEVMSLLAEKRLSRGLLTVIDALNVTSKFRNFFVKHAKRYKRPIYAIMMMTPLVDCENRHNRRPDRPWSIEILRKQYMKFNTSIYELKKNKHVKVILIYPEVKIKISLA